MLFSSPIFFCFFVLYYFIHVAIPKNWKILLLILGSTLFYSYWNPAYVWVPYLLISIAFLGAIWMESQPKSSSESLISSSSESLASQTLLSETKSPNTPKHNNKFFNSRKIKATFVILLLATPLLIFKYAHFLAESLFNYNIDALNLTLPLGISFITFSLIAYIVEVYQKRFPLEKNITNFSAYTLFFPHLIAGPILKPQELIPQLDKLNTNIQRKNLIFGLALFSLGLFKKLVFADPIGALVDPIFANPTLAISSWDYLLAIYGFSIQIYCDFSGYTDMALGIASFFGIHLPNNFSRPYCATSIIDFWRRWHITLSTWLRDYIYIPLGGNRKGKSAQIRNVLITMIIGGFWHGASWTFVVWGFCHGFLIAMNHLLKDHLSSIYTSMISITRNMEFLKKFPWLSHISKILVPLNFKLPPKLVTFFKILITFHLVTMFWILFRAPSLNIFYQVLSGPFHSSFHDISCIQKNIFPLLLMLLFFLTHRFDNPSSLQKFVDSKKSYFWAVIIFIWLTAITISTGSSAKFVYFDF